MLVKLFTKTPWPDQVTGYQRSRPAIPCTPLSRVHEPSCPEDVGGLRPWEADICRARIVALGVGAAGPVKALPLGHMGKR